MMRERTARATSSGVAKPIVRIMHMRATKCG